MLGGPGAETMFYLVIFFYICAQWPRFKIRKDIPWSGRKCIDNYGIANLITYPFHCDTAVDCHVSDGAVHFSGSVQHGTVGSSGEGRRAVDTSQGLQNNQESLTFRRAS